MASIYKSAKDFTAKNKDGSLIFTPKDKELVAYVPEKYFDRNIAEQSGEYINLIGVFDYTIQDINTGKKEPLRPFNLPTIFSTKPRMGTFTLSLVYISIPLRASAKATCCGVLTMTAPVMANV